MWPKISFQIWSSTALHICISRLTTITHNHSKCAMMVQCARFHWALPKSSYVTLLSFFLKRVMRKALFGNCGNRFVEGPPQDRTMNSFRYLIFICNQVMFKSSLHVFELCPVAMQIVLDSWVLQIFYFVYVSLCGATLVFVDFSRSMLLIVNKRGMQVVWRICSLELYSKLYEVVCCELWCT